MNSDTGGSAFPGFQWTEGYGPWRKPMGLEAAAEYHEPGMTLRDYFAAKAMQAAATNPTGADGFTFEQRATWAYQQADAMLEARRSKPQQPTLAPGPDERNSKS